MSNLTPFRYYGSKGRVAPWLISLFPEHQLYVEPFFGSGGIFFRKPPTRHELINDLDDHVVNFFRVLREQPEDLSRTCKLTPYSRVEYDHSKRGRSDEGAHAVERARRFFVTVTQSYACTTGTASGWSASMSGNVSRPRSTQNFVRRFEAIAERLENVAVESRPAIQVIENYADNPRTLIYCDPPYVHETRGDTGTGGHGYRIEMTDDDHRDLADALHATPAIAFISGYRSELYDELYADWESASVNTYSTIAGISNAKGAARTEVVWSNRPINDGRIPFG